MLKLIKLFDKEYGINYFNSNVDRKILVKELFSIALYVRKNNIDATGFFVAHIERSDPVKTKLCIQFRALNKCLGKGFGQINIFSSIVDKEGVFSLYGF